MFAKANKAYEASQPQQRKDLSKQLFPSSSPTPAANSKTDIRDQFKRAGGTAASAGTEPSRSSQSSQPYNNNSTAAFRGTTKGSLASLYGNTNSFGAQPSNTIDLTGSDAQAKLQNTVWFEEDDFSDDENLDLDYEAPSALPISSVPKPPVAVQSSRENVPPPTTQDIPWSSSPAGHSLPPKFERTVSNQTSTTISEGTLKRDSSGERDVTEAPVQKKAKRRVLPASFHQTPVEEDEDVPTVGTLGSKSREYLEPTASAIKEQRRQLKNQRLPQEDAEAQLAAAAQEAEQEAHLGKVETFSLSGEQKHILNLVVEKNQSVFFTGPAGTGKSVLMRAIISEMKRKYARDTERVAVTASTGLAACNIGGMTLHSFAGKEYMHLV